MFFCLLSFILAGTVPKRTKIRPTPTRSFNRKPVVISMSVIFPIIIITSIIATILFFIIAKRVVRMNLQSPESQYESVEFFEGLIPKNVSSVSHKPSPSKSSQLSPLILDPNVLAAHQPGEIIEIKFTPRSPKSQECLSAISRTSRGVKLTPATSYLLKEIEKSDYSSYGYSGEEEDSMIDNLDDDFRTYETQDISVDDTSSDDSLSLAKVQMDL